MTRMVLYDVEASGLHGTSYPVEVAWVAADLSEGFSATIKPAPSWTRHDWSSQAEEIHGLDYDLLARLGETPEAVADALDATFAGNEVLSDSPSMDGFWLNRLYQALDRAPGFPTHGIHPRWGISGALFSATRSFRRAMKALGGPGLYDSDVALNAALGSLGGGIPMYEAHSHLHEDLSAEVGLIAHRALDDCLSHALGFAAVDILAEPTAAARGDRYARTIEDAVALKHRVWAEEAERTGSPLRRPRSAVERAGGRIE